MVVRGQQCCTQASMGSLGTAVTTYLGWVTSIRSSALTAVPVCLAIHAEGGITFTRGDVPWRNSFCAWTLASQVRLTLTPIALELSLNLLHTSSRYAC
jgi:hypothetical protein